MRRVFNIRNFLILSAVVGLLILISAQQTILDRNIEKNNSLKQDIQQAEQQIQELENEKGLIGTDEYVEKKAREKLGYVKSNETVFVKNQ